MGEQDIVIEDKNLLEFEFDEEGFSIIYDRDEAIWYLETYGDDDESEIVLLDDESRTLEQETLDELGFSEKQFKKIQEFVSKENLL